MQKKIFPSISTFKSVRFSGYIGGLIAPPYDVFEYGDETDRRLRSNPENIIHIQKPLGDVDEKYLNASRTLEDFLKRKVLIEPDEKGIYIIRQSWEQGERKGLIAAVKLDDTLERIRPHEHTKKAPIEDRLKLTLKTGLNIGCIFSVFEDNNRSIGRMIENETERLLYSFEFPAGIKTEVYFSNNHRILSEIENKILYIADGHHRYSTMLSYRDIMRKKYAPGEAYEYTMMYLVPDHDCLILPYHRAVRLENSDAFSDLMKRIKPRFSVSTAESFTLPGKGSIGLLTKDEHYILTPFEKQPRIEAEILHDLIIEPILGISIDDIKNSDSVDFISGDTELEKIREKIVDGVISAAFLLPHPKFSYIKEAADSKRAMPQKSTYFFPKIPTGIIMRRCL